MKMKQVELRQDDGAKTIGWIDSQHAIVGRRVDLNLGDGLRSPVMEIINVWNAEVELEEVQEREVNRRSFGGSIK
jgi:hypothetical protein